MMTSQRSTTSQELLVIEPGSTAGRFWKDFWRYRELFFVLAWRDISVRYKQTAIGFAWALVRPFLTMVVFTVIFGRVAGLSSEAGVPYALLVFTGLLPWNLFSTALADAGNSVVGNASLISKVYFPRVVIPAAAVVIALVDFLISLIILVGLMVWYRFMPGWQIVTLPIFVAMTALAAIGPGLYFAAMTVRYRDFRIVIPFALQFGLYISPVGFSSKIIPELWRPIYSLNPVVGIIEGFRWCVLGGSRPLDWGSVSTSAVVIVLMLWFGLSRFRKNEADLVDAI
jgi:lipopolysaccharide transport system permease protein